MFEASGPRPPRRPRARPGRPGRRAGPRRLARAGRADQGAQAGRSRSRSSASTSSCPTPTCRSPRRSATPPGRTSVDAKVRWVDSEALTTENVARAPRRRGRRPRPGRLRPSRHRGQGPRRPLRPRAPRPVPRPVPRASSARSSSSPATSSGTDGRQLDRVRHVHRAPGHRLHARPARHGGQGRHDAPGPLPGQADARLEGRARSTARRSSTSGTATASRSTTATARRSRRPACSCPASRPTAGWWRSSSCATTRGSWPASSTRSSRAGRSGRTRCSTGSWRRALAVRDGREPVLRGPRRSAGSRRRRPVAAGVRCRRVRPQRLTSPSGPCLVEPRGRRLRHVDRRSAPRSASRPGSPTSSTGRYSLLIPANAIGVWLGVAFVLGASARTHPDRARCAGSIGLLTAVAVYYLLIARPRRRATGPSGPSHAATVWGAVALLAGPIMGGAGAVWRYGHGWPRAIGVALLAAALIAEGVVFGGPRLDPRRPARHRPGRAPVRAPRSSSGSPCRPCSCGAASGCAATSRRPRSPSSARSRSARSRRSSAALADRF